MGSMCQFFRRRLRRASLYVSSVPRCGGAGRCAVGRPCASSARARRGVGSGGSLLGGAASGVRRRVKSGSCSGSLPRCLDAVFGSRIFNGVGSRTRR